MSFVIFAGFVNLGCQHWRDVVCISAHCRKMEDTYDSLPKYSVRFSKKTEICALTDGLANIVYVIAEG